MILSMALLAWLAVPLGAESIASWSVKAEKAARQGEWDVAIEYYTNALRLWEKRDGPKARAKILAGRASVHESKRDFGADVKDLSEALAVEPKNSAWLHRRGQAYLALANFPKAIDDFYKAIALKLNFKEAYFDRGRAYEVQGETKFAREDYRSACKLGFKPACAKLKPPAPEPAVRAPEAPVRAQAQAPLPTPAPAAAPQPSAPPGASGESAKQEPVPESPKPEPKKPGAPGESPKPDFRACLKLLSRCLETGKIYDTCVSSAKICEALPAKVSPVPSCCPAACLAAYENQIGKGASQGEAYRRTFALGSDCAK